MTKRAGLALFLAMAALFLILNRAAYKGYFMHDDFEFLSWAPKLDAIEYLKGFLKPVYFPNNFRPVGHFYYHVMGKAFGLDFPKYVLSIHLLHLLNVWLLWLLIRKLGIGPVASSVGAFFFAFHAALFDAYWMPSYIFDVLCTTFCLLAFLAYLYDRWVWSLACLWAAYKSKELAVMFPAVLACYEIFLGQKRWKRLAPFFAVSLLFGVQGLIRTPHQDNIYAFHFTLRALGETIRFHSKNLFFAPYAGLALLALPPLVRDRRLWFGLASIVLYFGPLWFLPGRLVAVYWYLPMTGAAVALATLATLRYTAAVAVFLALWIPWDLMNFRKFRRATLALEDTNRVYVAQLAAFARSAPHVRSFVFDGAPPGLPDWGIAAALKCVYDRFDTKLYYLGHPSAKEMFKTGSAALLSWDPAARKLEITNWERPEQRASYLTMAKRAQLLQLDDGWYTLEDTHCWMKPDATATLWRPEGVQQFEIQLLVPPAQIERSAKTDVQVVLDGQALERQALTQPGRQTLRWSLRPAPAALSKVELHVQPAYRAPQDLRVLGLAVTSFGYLSR